MGLGMTLPPPHGQYPYPVPSAYEMPPVPMGYGVPVPVAAGYAMPVPYLQGLIAIPPGVLCEFINYQH